MAADFQIFVKPAGSVCNLACSYCYYLGKKDLYQGAVSLQMNEKVLENYIKQHIEASDGNSIMFSWHGGEPTLAGMDFYREVVKLQNRHKPAGASILNGIQTNATLLNDEWCRFFADENFIAGVSLDGPEKFHNRFRHNVSGAPSFKNAMAGLALLLKHSITTEVLCVVSSYNSGNPLEVYRFFRQLDIRFMTFLPLVMKLPGSTSSVTPESVGPEDFGSFLSSVFDEWIAADIGKIKVQIFEEALRTAFSQDHTLCIFRENCGRVPVVEFNGDFYSCDHYVDRDHLLGNIMKGRLSDFIEDERQVAFGRVKSVNLPRYCLNCEVKKMCNGECPKNRFIKTPDGEDGLNYLCKGYRQFFNHCRPFTEAVAAVWRNRKTDFS